MNMDKTKVIGVSILIAVSTTLYIVFIAPQTRQLEAVRLEYAASKKLLAAREGQMENIGEARRANAEWKKKFQSARNKFFKENEINQFLKGISRLADKTGNKLKTVDLLQRRFAPEEHIKKIAVEVVIIGKYVAAIDLMKLLSSGKKLLDISDIRMEREDEARQDLITSFTLTLFVFTGEDE